MGDQIEVDVTRISLTPNRCRLVDEVKMVIEFYAAETIRDAWWDISYVVDQGSKRHVIELGSTEKTTYRKGDNDFKFQADRIELSGIKSSVLRNNMGLLRAALNDGREEVIEIKMVCEVTERDGRLYRNIMNPLE